MAPTRRQLIKSAGVTTAAVPVLGSGIVLAETQNEQPGCSEWRQPDDNDFAAVVQRDKAEFLNAVLTVIETEQIPLTLEGVRHGNKLFGAMVLKKADLSTVLVATNTEAENPLAHGEVTAINAFYALPDGERPNAEDCLFISTHEPCPLCLSSITWGGFDNFFYLFTYEDSRDAYGIPHDIVMIDEIFRCPDGSYSEKNKYWSCWYLGSLAQSVDSKQRAGFNKRIAAIKDKYAELSAIYQEAKAAGTGADVPLK